MGDYVQVVLFRDKDSKDEVFLIKRKKAKKEYIPGKPFTIESKWGLPGGTQEPGETLIKTGQREVEEETGYEIEISPLIRYRVRRRHQGGGYHWAITLCGWVVGGKMELGEEIEKGGWFPVKSLPKRKEIYKSHFKALREILTLKGIYI